jgi:hypothetical protein
LDSVVFFVVLLIDTCFLNYDVMMYAINETEYTNTSGTHGLTGAKLEPLMEFTHPVYIVLGH